MAGGGPSYHYKFSLPVAQLSISPALASDTRLELTSTAHDQTKRWTRKATHLQSLP